MKLRAAIFFLAVVVLARSMALALQALFSASPTAGALPADLRYLLTHLPFAIVFAMLFAHARIVPRLPPHPAWYALLAAFALAKVAIYWISFPYMWLATPALLVAVVLVLLRVAPRTGDLYESSLMPGVTAFLGFSLLLATSWPVDYGVLAMQKAGLPSLRLPILVPNLVIAMAVAGIFIVASGIRHRSMQPNPASAWLWIGIVLTVVAETVNITMRGFFKAEYLLAVRATAHLALLVGSFYLLSHLLPRRAADEAH
jgi:hypothetical protein